jgi:hypothetical protein
VSTPVYWTIGHEGYYVIKPVSVLKFFRGIVRGTFRALLTPNYFIRPITRTFFYNMSFQTTSIEINFHAPGLPLLPPGDPPKPAAPPGNPFPPFPPFPPGKNKPN